MATPTKASQYEFSVFEVGETAYTRPWKLNNAGQIVGWILDFSQNWYPGFVYDGESFMFLEVPGARSTTARSIDASGNTVVGQFQDGDGVIHGFSLSHGVYTTIDVPDVRHTFVTDINSAGQILGFYEVESDGSRTRKGFLFSGGEYTDIAVPDSLRTEAWGLNDAGEIVGEFSDHDGIHSFLFSDGVYDRLALPPSTSDRALAINNQGEILGDLWNEGDGGKRTHYVLRGDELRPFVVPDANTSLASGINDAGQIVGQFTTGPVPNGRRSLGFLATPVPEPGAWKLLVIASSLWFCMRQTCRSI